jgi:hypothetical protein
MRGERSCFERTLMLIEVSTFPAESMNSIGSLASNSMPFHRILGLFRIRACEIETSARTLAIDRGHGTFLRGFEFSTSFVRMMLNGNACRAARVNAIPRRMIQKRMRIGDRRDELGESFRPRITTDATEHSEQAGIPGFQVLSVERGNLTSSHSTSSRLINSNWDTIG